MDLCATPSATVASFASAYTSTTSNTPSIARSRNIEVQILDRVSLLTLEEPSTPKTPFQTPTVRKRKPSCVTPPRGQLRHMIDTTRDEPLTFKSSNRKKIRGLRVPMLPESPELDGSASHNPFGQHKPLHSPIMRISHVNYNYMPVLQNDDDQDRDELPTVCPSQAKDTFPREWFPSLEEPIGDLQTTRRVLKMRRRPEDFPLFTNTKL